MISQIKKLVSDYQSNKRAKCRKANNKKQLELIYKGLIERG